VDRIAAIVREAGARIQALVPRRKTLEDFFMAQVLGPAGTTEPKGKN